MTASSAKSPSGSSALWAVFWAFLICFSFRYFFVDPGAYWSGFLCPLLFENSNFESGDFSHWNAKGTAFEGQPVSAASRPVKGVAEGGFRIYTYGKNNDSDRGRLISEPFQIRRDRISFLLGGGDGSGRTGIRLQIGGKTVRFAKSDSRMWTSEKMSRVLWDVSEFSGKSARLVLIDHSTGDWGHLNTDDFRYA
jgi:hypothetical protein